MFQKPFGPLELKDYQLPSAVDLWAQLENIPEPPSAWRSWVTWTSLGVGLASLGSGGFLSWKASQIQKDIPDDANQEEVQAANQRIERHNAGAIALYVIAGAALTTTLVVQLWPESPAQISLVPTPEGGVLSAGFRF